MRRRSFTGLLRGVLDLAAGFFGSTRPGEGAARTTVPELRVYQPPRPHAPVGLVAGTREAGRSRSRLEEDFEESKERLSRRLVLETRHAHELASAFAERLESDLEGIARGVELLDLPSRGRQRRERSVSTLARMLALASEPGLDLRRDRLRNLKRLRRTVVRLRWLLAGLRRRKALCRERDILLLPAGGGTGPRAGEDIMTEKPTSAEEGLRNAPAESNEHEAPDGLDLAFADLRAQLKEQLARLATLGREVTLAIAARVDADAAIAETALASLELLPRGKKQRREQVRRLERLHERLSRIDVDPAKGRRRDLRRIARAIRDAAARLTDPVE